MQLAAAAGQHNSQCKHQLHSQPRLVALACAAQSTAGPSNPGTAQGASSERGPSTEQSLHPSAVHRWVRAGDAFLSSSNQQMDACSSQPGPPAALQRALAGVVLIRTRSSWATGVLISEGGLLLTNAHLLVPNRVPVHRPTSPSAAPPSAPSSSITEAAAGALAADLYPSCSVRIPAQGLSPGQGQRSRQRWLPARVMYVFRNHLDLAVLQLDAAELQREGLWLQPLQLQEADSTFRCTEDVLVLGHGLFGPSAGLDAGATHGNIAKVVHADGRPSMLLTTASVHSGASGGALVSRQGKLLGLVTSNARHVSGATLSRFNFCIALEELQPIVRVLLALEHKEKAATLQGAVQGMQGPVLQNSATHASQGRQQRQQQGVKLPAHGSWVHNNRPLTVFQVTMALEGLDQFHQSADRIWKLQDPYPASKL
mmetsp:Transcript_3040/g.7981  ORF Transcript_3040/g.7981 Transcript_3040/m.7981 type:complete len:427 (+) Transcript_3040:2-1282(+)